MVDKVQQLRGDLLEVVSDMATDYADQHWYVQEGIARLLELHEKDNSWWVRRMPYSNFQWMAEACRAIGRDKEAAFFDEKHENRREALANLAHYRKVIRRRGKDGKLYTKEELLQSSRRSPGRGSIKWG